MSKSVILQVDESTKGLMEEIQSGITSSIEDGIREVKDMVESVDDNTDTILRKFKNFDGLSNTVDQLRFLAEESKKFTAIVSPLQISITELKQGNKTHEQALSQVSSNINLLVKEVVGLSDRQNNLASEMKNNVQNVLKSLEEGDNNAKKVLDDVMGKMAQADIVRQEISDKLNSSLCEIKGIIEELTKSIDNKSAKLEMDTLKISEFQVSFSETYAKNEYAHQIFEAKASSQIEDVNKSIEKIQASLDIIVNLVTPFWKKWK